MNNTSKAPGISARYRTICILFFAGTMLIGAGALIGWATNFGRGSIVGDLYLNMKPFTALFFIGLAVLGVVQMLWPERWVRTRRVAALAIFLFAALFAFFNATGGSSALANVLFPHAVAAADPRRGGLISMGTALGLLFLSSSFLAVLSGRTGSAAKLLIVPFSIGALGLLGHAYGVQQWLTMDSGIGLPLLSALGLVLLAMGAWISVPENRLLDLLTSPSLHARALRRIGPPLIVVPVLLGMLEAHTIRSGHVAPALASALTTLAQIIILGAMLAWHLTSVYREQLLRGAAEADREDFLSRLAESEQRLRLALSGGAMGWWELDPVKWTARLSPETAMLFGLPIGTEHAKYEQVRALVHAEDRGPMRLAMQQALKGFGNYAAEYRVTWPDGNTHWLASRARILRDEHGRPERVVGVTVDVTERRRAEEALRASERKFRQIVETANEGIWMLDADARIELVNPRLAEMFGYSESEMLGKQKFDFVVPEDVAHAREHFQRRREGLSEQYELRFRHRDGTVIWTLFSARPMIERGKFAGALDMITDITERKAAELRLLEAEAKLRHYATTLEERVKERTAALRETIAQLESFSYSITHDMRGPLRAISGFAGLIEHDYGAQLDDTAHSYLGRMIAAAQRLDSLIQDVLNYSRLSKGEITVEPVPLFQLIEDIIQQYPNFAPHKEDIHVEHFEYVVRGNLAAVTQAISNLIGNALKFVPRGRTPSVQIRCEQRMADDRQVVRLWVEDNGIGILPEYHMKIWGAFQRLHHVDEYAGTGIGLAIVKKAVERMNGNCGVESQAGKGSRFWIELPEASGEPTEHRTPVVLPTSSDLAAHPEPPSRAPLRG